MLCDKENVYGVGIALEENEVYHIPVEGLVTGEYLCGKLEELSKTTILCCMDVKSVLKHVKLTEASKVFDVGIGVYLLNPLKSSYTLMMWQRNIWTENYFRLVKTF